MNPHDKAAFTGALRSALQMLDDETRAEFVRWALDIGAQTMKPALGGTLSVSTPKPKIGLDGANFDQWVREHHPDEIETRTVEQVRPAFETAVRSKLAVVDDVVVWKDTGEVCDFAVATPPGRPYAAWKGGDEAKAEVLAWLRNRLDAVAELMAADMKQVES